MKIGILGCGYIGQAAAIHWKNKGHQISVTTRSPERVEQLQRFADDVYLLTEQSLLSFLQELEVLLISVAPDSSADYATTYLQTATDIKKLIHQSPSLRQILYTSSTSVYGDRQGKWVDEGTLIHCQDENKRILYETEQTLLDSLPIGSLPQESTIPTKAGRELDICILRLGEIYGPGREIEQRLKRMQHQPFAGNGESYTNLIHKDDIINGLDFALSHHLQGIYNLCNDFHIPRKEFYEQICLKEGIPAIHWEPNRVNPHSGNRRVSNQKIKDKGFTFTHPYF